MRTLRIYRSGRVILTVTLENDVLRLEGNPHLIRSLEEEGVVDLSSGRNLRVSQYLKGEEASLVFKALCSHFQRASVYSVDIET